ncbi:hypothetical protein GCM10023210_39860 [Chryseobacterium ginsengisoli]|uniref:Uncharacterized protein n=1 Tax=Chryseobacterium ginsengisoli TaxID=363853 RepID=A0ABP9MYU9_9FLAO
MENKPKQEPLSDIHESALKIAKILNGKSLFENKKILEKINEILEGSSILTFRN